MVPSQIAICGEHVSGAELIEAPTGNSSDLYRKVLRVKAGKTLQWLDENRSVYNVFLSVVWVTLMERIMYQFMKWQETQAYLLEIDPPMVVMASSLRSPACVAIRDMIGTMLSGKAPGQGDSEVTIADLLDGNLLAMFGTVDQSVFGMYCIITSGVRLRDFTYQGFSLTVLAG